MKTAARLLILMFAASSCFAQERNDGATDNTHLVLAVDEIWQPGSVYTSGTDWLALACDAAGCALEAGQLTVRTAPQSDRPDDAATEGQRLHFARNAPGRPTVIAWLRRDKRLPWLRPAVVTTYGSNVAGFSRPSSAGTLELSVIASDHELSRLVPLLDQNQNTYVLQLRSEGKRQVLDQLWSCGDHFDTGYLLWAGDLDKDKRPDYLISYLNGYGGVVLYLSGMAQGDELVAPGLKFTDATKVSCPSADD